MYIIILMILSPIHLLLLETTREAPGGTRPGQRGETGGFRPGAVLDLGVRRRSPRRGTTRGADGGST